MKVGNLVYIKSEGSKHKARDRYIIVKIEGLYAILQEFGDKFMSRQYKVPIGNIFLAPSTSKLHSIIGTTCTPLLMTTPVMTTVC